MIEIIISASVIIGALFVLLGAIGLVKFPDFYTRLHAPTKASTLGIGAIAFGSLLCFSSQQAGFSWHELLLMLFLLSSAPLTAHMLARAALVNGGTHSSAINNNTNSSGNRNTNSAGD
jgi:multicomponent K+:H+ antiporter subunit G